MTLCFGYLENQKQLKLGQGLTAESFEYEISKRVHMFEIRPVNRKRLLVCKTAVTAEYLVVKI